MRALALAFATCLATPSLAWACSLSGPEKLQIEANPADTSPPTLLEVAVAKVQRGDDWGEDDGCGSGTSTSCDGFSYVQLRVAASDEVSSTIGYRVEGPRLMGSGQVLVARDGLLTLHLEDHDSGEDTLRLSIEVAAVDEAGNVSEPRTIEVRDEGSGCALGGGSSGALLLLITLATRSALFRRTRGAAASRP